MLGILRVFLLLVIQLFITIACNGQTSAVNGRVVDRSGNPLAGAIITLQHNGQKIITNETGFFSVKNVSSGTFEFIIRHHGYKEKRFSVNVFLDTTLLDNCILDTDTRELEEVVINSIHSGQKLFETLSTEIINGNFVRKNLGGSLMQSLEKLPGIKSIHIGSSNAKPLIRGLGFNQVIVVENGIKHEGQQWGADHALEIDQFNVSRMEISKGPSSFLYGSDAIGGAIVIKPSPKPLPGSLGGYIDLVGKTNNMQYGGSFNIFGRTEKWFFDARLTYLDYADYRVPTNTIYSYSYAVKLNSGLVRNTAGREFNTSVSTGYIGKNISSTFYVSSTFNKSGFFANAHGLEPRNVDEKVQDASSRDIQLPYQQVSHKKIINRTALRAGLHMLEVNAAFQNNFREEHSLYVNHGYMPPVYPSSMPYPKDLERRYNKNVWSINLKDELDLDKHRLSFGINTEMQRNAIGGWGFLIPAFSNYNIGGFVYDKYFLSDKLFLQGALRYDYGYININAYNDWFESDIIQNGETSKERLARAPAFARSFNSFTWSGGLNYNADKTTLTLNVGKGFRMPIAKELAANGVNYHYFRYEKGNASLKPESSYQLDIGFDWKDKKKHFRFTPYFNYFSNYIYLNPTADYDTYYGAGNQVFNYTQARVVRAGAELQAGIQLLKYWHAAVAGEYVFNRQLSGEKKWYSLPFTPPASALFTLSYEPELLKKWFSETYINMDCRLVAAQTHIVPPEKKTPGYNAWSLSMGTSIKLGFQPVQVNLRIQNLFNQKYLSHTSFYRLIELPEPGRNIILTLKIPFTIKKA